MWAWESFDEWLLLGRGVGKRVAELHTAWVIDFEREN